MRSGAVFDSHRISVTATIRSYPGLSRQVTGLQMDAGGDRPQTTVDAGGPNAESINRISCSRDYGPRAACSVAFAHMWSIVVIAIVSCIVIAAGFAKGLP